MSVGSLKKIIYWSVFVGLSALEVFSVEGVREGVLERLQRPPDHRSERARAHHSAGFAEVHRRARVRELRRDALPGRELEPALPRVDVGGGRARAGGATWKGSGAGDSRLGAGAAVPAGCGAALSRPAAKCPSTLRVARRGFALSFARFVEAGTIPEDTPTRGRRCARVGRLLLLERERPPRGGALPRGAPGGSSGLRWSPVRRWFGAATGTSESADARESAERAGERRAASRGEAAAGVPAPRRRRSRRWRRARRTRW